MTDNSHKQWRNMLFISAAAAVLTAIIIPLAVLLPIYGLAGSSFENKSLSEQRAIDHKLHLAQTFMTLDRVLMGLSLIGLLISIFYFFKTKNHRSS